MNEARKVNLVTKLNILKRRPRAMLFGFLFTLLPIFIAIIFSIVFSGMNKETPNVDFDLTCRQGRETTAIVTNVETQYNVTINGVHPTIISYKYQDNGKEINTKFKTLSEIEIQQLEIGGEIPIKEFKGNSVIPNLKPHDFSIWLFVLFPLSFFFFGLPFLLYSIFHLKKELCLFRYGNVSSGKIISMMPNGGLFVSNLGRGLIVHYEYETMMGEKVMTESFTTDFSILNDKKRGEYIPIFISSDDEKKSCLVPKLDSLRNNWNIEFE
jgi:hypothetical protein